MSWSKVGNWLKDNAGSGAALVGSLVTGNIPGAVAAGVSMVASATGTDNPNDALMELQTNPETLVKLKELYYENEKSVRLQIQEMKRLELEDAQKEHHETQETIRAGDVSKDGFIRAVRPTHATLSLCAGIWYAFTGNPSVDILGVFMILPLSYSGLRGWDKYNQIKNSVTKTIK